MTTNLDNTALLAKMRTYLLSSSTEPIILDPDSQESISGAVVNGYRLGEIIGSGASGVVFAAEKEGRSFAIKLIAGGSAENRDLIALLQREVKIGQELNHPALVATHEAFELGPGTFLVLDRVYGETLEQVVQKELSAGELLAIFEQLAGGLQAAHDMGVVHRDLKPENIMVGDRPGLEVKILDFGMARLMGGVSVTSTGVFKGTLKYTSPEQVKDTKRVGPETDQFALGLIVFEALSGVFPYEVDEKFPMKTMMNRLTDQPKNLCEVTSLYSEETALVVNRMLSMEPEERFPSVREAFEALRASMGR